VYTEQLRLKTQIAVLRIRVKLFQEVAGIHLHTDNALPAI